LTRGRELDHLPRTVKQRDAQKQFELRDRPAQSRLCQGQAKRGAGEAALLCYCDEAAQVAKLDTRSSALMKRTFLSLAHGIRVMHLTHNGSEIGISVCRLGVLASESH